MRAKLLRDIRECSLQAVSQSLGRMPVSLHDSMRLVAIAMGLGAGAGGERGFPLLASVLGGVVFGTIAFFVVGRLENLWFARVVAQPNSKAGEASYVAS